MSKQVKQYGAWESPITPELALSSSVSVASPSVANGQLLWLEGRPAEKGRTAIVQADLSDLSNHRELLPNIKFNSRTRVHEYGGLSYLPRNDGSVIFSNFSDNAVYQVKQGSEPKRLSPDKSIWRYAHFAAHPKQSNKVLSILEDHTRSEPANVVNSLVILDADKGTVEPFVSGTDFYSAPAWSPSGKYVAWVEWKHPDMPWEGSLLQVAQVSEDLTVSNVVKVAGAPKNVESVSQPRWHPEEDKIVFLSDRTGYYELYEWSPEKSTVRLVLEQPTGEDAGGPDWMIGQSTHAPLSASHWICAAKDGKLRVIDRKARKDRLVDTPFASVDHVTVLSPEQVAVVGSPHEAPARLSILEIGSSSSAKETIVKKTSDNEVDSGYVSIGEHITYPTKSAPGEADGQVSHAIFYPPQNKDFEAPEGTLPPLVVRCHGGPTSAAHAGLNWNIQLFTSRGFAFADINYGGSTGFGKDFRKRLDGQWGVVDVADTIAAVEYLAKEGKVDAKKCSIAGGSAGGFTVLAALTDSTVFGAGVSLYGVADLKLLADDTHKFESQYLFKLVGGTPAEVPDVYRDRSPINKVKNITAPLLLLQGTEDKVVPPEQAQIMADKINANGGQVELVMFEGEGHGFRQAENRLKAVNMEIAFYRQTFGIQADDP